MTITEISTEAKASSQENAGNPAQTKASSRIISPPAGYVSLRHLRPAFDERIKAAGCVEVCLFEAKIEDGFYRDAKGERFKATYVGYFNDYDSLVRELKKVDKVNVFWTFNPFKPNLRAKSLNKLKRVSVPRKTEGDSSGTPTKMRLTDADILAYEWLYIDIDSVRDDKEISATDEELNETLAVRDRILDDHPEIKAAATWGCSGNGAYILVRIKSLDTTDQGGKATIKAALTSLGGRYAVPGKAEIDPKTLNPSRLTGVAGTGKCKGSPIPECPHRLITFEKQTEGELVKQTDGELVPIDLEQWVADNPAPTPATQEEAGALPSPSPAKAASTTRNGKGKTKGRKGGANPKERYRAYLAAKPEAIQGQNGSGQLFSAVCDGIQGFILSPDDVYDVVSGDYNARCQPPWPEAEIRHKIGDAVNRPCEKPPGYLLDARPASWEASPTGSATAPQGQEAAGSDDDPLEDIRGSEDSPARLADLVLDEYQHQDDATLRYCPTLRFWQGDFWEWDKTRYRQIPAEEFQGRVNRVVTGEFLRIHAIEMAEWEEREGEERGRAPREIHATGPCIRDVISRIKALCCVEAANVADQPAWILAADDRLEDYPDPKWVIPVENGLVCVPPFGKGKGVELISHTPKFFSTNARPFAYDPDAPEPERWWKFLNEILPGGDEKDQIRLLQQWTAYCLTSDTRQHVMLAMIGVKRSGKSTYAAILEALLGHGNVSHPPLASFASDFGLCELASKPLAIISEAHMPDNADRSTITENIKAIVGEDPRTMNRKYKTAITAKLPTRIMVVANRPPKFADSSNALKARLRVVQTRRSFEGEEDRGLQDRLPAELPGIFNWAISCLQEPYAPGQFLAQPDIPGGLLEEMWESMSPIGDFLAEDMEKEAGAWVFTEDVANAFADRYPAYRNSKAYDARSIAVEIRIVDPTIERGQKRDPRHGDKPRPILKGVRLRK